MKIIKRIWPVVLLIAAIAAGYWFYQTRIATTSQVSGASTTYTQIVQVRTGSLSSTVSVVGELDSTQSEQLAFTTLEGTTKLSKLNVAAGNSVKQGQVLASIDNTSYQQALDQAKSELAASEKTLADLTAAPTALELAQDDADIATAEYDLQKARQDLVDLQSPDLVSLKNAVDDAQDNLTLLGLNQQLAERDSLAKSERDLSYTVNWYQRRVNELEAQKRKNLEETQELADDQTKLAELQADLARVQAQRNLAKTAKEAEKTKDQVALADAQKALATAQAGGDQLTLAQDQLAIQTAQVELDKAKDAKAKLLAGPDATELATDQADVDQKKLAVSDAETALAGTELKASFDGTVLATNVQPGDDVTASTVVLTVANLKSLQVVASVDETTIKRVTAGQKATITFDAFPGTALRGQVLSVPLQGSLQNDVMVYEVPLRLEGADKLALLVGMTANVKVQVAEAADALLVPAMALEKVNGLYQVLVPTSSDAKGAPVAVPVEVGLSDGTYTQITKGLNVGDEVVVQVSSTAGQSNSNDRPGGPVFFMDGGPGGPPPGR